MFAQMWLFAHSFLHISRLHTGSTGQANTGSAVVTPLCKATSYEPPIAILGIWGDTWITRGKYGIYVAVRGSYGALTGSTWRQVLPRKISTIYCDSRVFYVAVTGIPSIVLRNTWHYYVKIRYSYGELPKFVSRCSYEAALRKGVTTALGSKRQVKGDRSKFQGINPICIFFLKETLMIEVIFHDILYVYCVVTLYWTNFGYANKLLQLHRTVA